MLVAASMTSYDEYLTCGSEFKLVTNVQGNGGLPATKLIHPKGSEALIYHHGATITSFKTANSREGRFAKLSHPYLHPQTMLAVVLFVSSKAVFDGKKPIRGGIPIVFPKVLPYLLSSFCRDVP